MKLIPQQYYLLIQLFDTKTDGKIVTIDGKQPSVMPFGRVLLAGPDCKFCAAGDNVIFNLVNAIGFENFKQFIIAEGSVFAKLDLEGVEVLPTNFDPPTIV